MHENRFKVRGYTGLQHRNAHSGSKFWSQMIQECPNSCQLEANICLSKIMFEKKCPKWANKCEFEIFILKPCFSKVWHGLKWFGRARHSSKIMWQFELSWRFSQKCSKMSIFEQNNLHFSEGYTYPNTHFFTLMWSVLLWSSSDVCLLPRHSDALSMLFPCIPLLFSLKLFRQ